MAMRVMNRIEVPAFNSHVHFRQGAMMRAVVPFTAANFTEVIVEPNLEIPIVSVSQAEVYRDQILAAVPKGLEFEPHIALYACKYLDPAEFRIDTSFMTVVKVYPAHGTTQSEYGVNFEEWLANPWFMEILAQAELWRVPVQFHGEVPVWRGKEVDPFDREPIFYGEIAPEIRSMFPGLQMACEHISTQDAVEWVRDQHEDLVTASVTPHHLLKNRTDWLGSGSDSTMECKPPLKRANPHQESLIEFVTSGDPRAQAGTDSAPHPLSAKHGVRTACGAFVDHAALAMYATVFEREDALDKLPEFLSSNARRFYDLEPSNRKIVLIREPHTIPEMYTLDGIQIRPFAHGETFPWRVEMPSAE